ncbi:MAG: protein phosphatase 2C domain-containing protein [Pegethrix bostrychoides GSE-TBD4-15B]|jgi:serine/threonine protein phosphatase PrpC|uniref:Protein phosphatase 2C domain-containing protein n=1 Tax=Pegethrix bostrychoides GSE-TBD4-15B TaxID=2839662 RepID=A0A951P6P8_9CYAN|nr:protein phosphatase 2C domain-containing protein [Pegethrix bostrychoides GSE-TBD4-15B]
MPTLKQLDECPNCHLPILLSDRFCEGCGQLLDNFGNASLTCPKCGAAAPLDSDGYCSHCGVRAETSADHIEIRLSANLAGVSDRGLVHAHNEDALALYGSDQVQILVVCDGVSCSYRPQLASGCAAQTICEALVDQADTDPADAILAAVARAQLAVAAILHPSGAEASATTVVAAVCKAGRATIGWLGDSRAYWVAAEPNAAEPNAPSAVQLSQDHSWQAHAITRWLGADAEAGVPDLVTVPLLSSGCLLLCSDGLWNYTEASSLAELVSMEAEAAVIAQQLVDYACAQGAHDNVTVAVYKFAL